MFTACYIHGKLNGKMRILLKKKRQPNTQCVRSSYTVGRQEEMRTMEFQWISFDCFSLFISNSGMFYVQHVHILCPAGDRFKSTGPLRPRLHEDAWSFQQLPAQRCPVCISVCVFVMQAHCVMAWNSSARSHYTVCMCLCLNMRKLFPAGQCKCSLVVLSECVCVFMFVCLYLKLFRTIRTDDSQNEHGPPVMALVRLKQYTQEMWRTQTVLHSHTQTHTSTSWPNYTEMRNEMETNLPRKPVNLKELKDTHRIHILLHTHTHACWHIVGS